MLMKYLKCSIVFLQALLIVACDKVDNATGRWYSLAQAQHGKVVYAANCAQCHGMEAQGTFNWRDALADGSYPPPPLNGTAHTWHHSLPVLLRTVRDGGVKLGGKMPAFGSRLSASDREAVIAFIQSKWDNNIYQAWLDRGGLK